MPKLITTSFLLLFTAFVFSKTFIREYTYHASDMDSKLSCRAIATDQLRMELLNEIGAYVESEQILSTKEVGDDFSQNFTENIATISAGITEFEILNETWNGETYWMKASISVDKKDLEQKLKQLISDRQKTQELAQIQTELLAANKELDSLRKALDSVKEENKALVKNDYENQINVLSSKDYFLQGFEALNQENYQQAISLLSKSITLNANNANAYGNRGIAKSKIGDHIGAIKDFDQVIKLKPNDPQAYFSRGLAHVQLDHKIDAIQDYSTAIKLDPKNADYYYNRGNIKYYQGDKYGAIKDYDLVLLLRPNDKWAYYNRGNAYHEVGNSKSACADWTKSGDLGDNKAYNLIKKFCR